MCDTLSLIIVGQTLKAIHSLISKVIIDQQRFTALHTVNLMNGMCGQSEYLVSQQNFEEANRYAVHALGIPAASAPSSGPITLQLNIPIGPPTLPSTLRHAFARTTELGP